LLIVHGCDTEQPRPGAGCRMESFSADISIQSTDFR
jgi:hypothetical protein